MRTTPLTGAMIAAVLVAVPASSPAKGPKDGPAAGKAIGGEPVMPFATKASCENGAPGKCASKPKKPRGDAAVKVGERYPNPHIVTSPGRYGLSNPPEGEAYAVIGTSLVRIDPGSGQVLSILRQIEGPRD